MIISVASGKGGTGKTTFASSLALSLKEELSNLSYIDCDVEEPNSHIFIKPHIQSKKNVCVPIPEVDEEKCNFCGKCQEICEYNAIAVITNKVDDNKGDKKGEVLVFPELCHGCGGCTLLCPQNAISEKNKKIGVTESGVRNNMDFVHGLLDVGQIMSPPLIREVKDSIIEANSFSKKDKVIIDAPPGTSCPVVESVEGSDFCILVTEPTPFGLNDLKLAVGLIRKLNMKFGVVINRAEEGLDIIHDYCNKEGIDILMEIPFDRKIAEAYSRGVSIIEVVPEYKKQFLDLYYQIKKEIG